MQSTKCSHQPASSHVAPGPILSPTLFPRPPLSPFLRPFDAARSPLIEWLPLRPLQYLQRYRPTILAQS
jgi:hypothetical protein